MTGQPKEKVLERTVILEVWLLIIQHTTNRNYAVEKFILLSETEIIKESQGFGGTNLTSSNKTDFQCTYGQLI